MNNYDKTYKIYSRKRLNFIKSKTNRGKNNSKILYFMIIIIIVIFTEIVIYKSVNPIFENICEDSAKSIATKITNDQSTKAMKGYSYSDLFSIEKDNEGNVQMINANIFTIDEITSNISKYIQEELENSPSSNVKLSLGSLLGLKFLAGIGPSIKIKVSSTGKVESELKSEFTSQGINQTLHKIYLNIKCQVSILTPFNTIKQEITSQVLLSENIIVGQIPSNYYNINGTNGIISQNTN